MTPGTWWIGLYFIGLVQLPGSLPPKPLEPAQQGRNPIYLPTVILEVRGGRTEPSNAGCEVTERVDSNSTGRIDRIVRRQYDRHANQVFESRDTDGDGAAEVELRWRYSEVGDLLEKQSSVPAGRRFKTDQRYEYDDARRLVRVYLYSQVTGALSSVSYYEYDRLGRPVAVRQDLDGDDVIDDQAIWHYAGPNLVRIEVDKGADGTIDRLERRTWRGRLHVRSEFDSNADGVVDRVVEYSYDRDARLMARLNDENADGVTDWDEYYAYDARSRLLRLVIYREGVVEYVGTYAYDARDRISSESRRTLFSTDTVEFEFACDGAAAMSSSSATGMPDAQDTPERHLGDVASVREDRLFASLTDLPNEPMPRPKSKRALPALFGDELR